MTVPNAKWQPGTGKQVILKENFVDLENAILSQGTVRMQPPLVWVDVATVRVEATPDCPAAMQFTGLPNILNSAVQVGVGLTDGKIRTNTSNVSMLVASGGLYGSEKNSQWYALFALAANTDTTFTLKSMPIMRVKSQASQVISLGTLTTPATGIGYGFTTNELIGGLIYVLSGASRGLMRTISANNNDNSAGGTITYSGAALTLAAGDWFIVLPPGTNFRLVGTFFNNSSGNIVKFRRLGNEVIWLDTVNYTYDANLVVEDIRIACPLAISVRTTHSVPGFMAHPGAALSTPIGGAAYGYAPGGAPPYFTIESFLEFCRYQPGDDAEGGVRYSIGYGYPPGCGY